jgi:hypothetical protein
MIVIDRNKEYNITYWDTNTQSNITKTFNTITIFSIVDYIEDKTLYVNINEWDESIQVFTSDNYDENWTKDYINTFLVNYFINK